MIHPVAGRRVVAALAQHWPQVLVAVPLGITAAATILVPVLPADAMHLSRGEAGVYNGVVAVLWLGALLSSVFLMGVRVLRYLIVGIPVPKLLWRDMASKLGLAAPLCALFAARLVAGGVPAANASIDNPLSTWLPWLLWTTVPAVLGMGTFLYFEVFVIDRWLPRDGRPAAADEPVVVP